MLKPIPPEVWPTADVTAPRRIAIAAIGSQMLVVLAYITRVGFDRLPSQVGRIVVTALLCWGIFRKFAWARWALLALVGLGIITAGAATITLWSAGYKRGAVEGATFILAYLVVARLLLSDGLDLFLESRGAT